MKDIKALKMRHNKEWKKLDKKLEQTLYKLSRYIPKKITYDTLQFTKARGWEFRLGKTFRASDGYYNYVFMRSWQHGKPTHWKRISAYYPDIPYDLFKYSKNIYCERTQEGVAYYAIDSQR